MPRNLVTALDLFGGLIAPREDGEPLDEYAERVRVAAEAMSERDTAAGDGAWREAREQELEGHLGTEVTLKAAGSDPGLLDRAEEQLFTYESLSEREGPFRWPETNASGPAALYNWTTPAKGGVAAPGSLAMEERSGRIVHGPGYVWADGTLWYVPARPERAVFPLPSGTTETVIIPWQIESRHAHRLEIEDERRLRMVASDHEHVIRRTREGWTQESGPHTHDMTAISTRGPASMVTRTARPRTAEPAKTGDTIPGVDGVNERLAWPARHPGPVQAQTDDGTHAHLVDPNDYWSGDFVFYGEDHRHNVEDWTVQMSDGTRRRDGHTHPLTKPSIPDYRPLWPLISRHEGTKLREETGNPYVANLRIEDGWTVAYNEEGFSEELVLRYDTGDRREVPRPEIGDGDAVGLGPDTGATSIAITEVIEAYVGPDLVFKVRAEDEWTGGVEGEQIHVTHDQGGDVTVYTGEDGRALVRMPTPDSSSTGQNITYTITAEIIQDGSPVASTTEDIEVEFIGEVDSGYGYDYGMDWGN